MTSTPTAASQCSDFETTCARDSVGAVRCGAVRRGAARHLVLAASKCEKKRREMAKQKERKKREEEERSSPPVGEEKGVRQTRARWYGVHTCSHVCVNACEVFFAAASGVVALVWSWPLGRSPSVTRGIRRREGDRAAGAERDVQCREAPRGTRRGDNVMRKRRQRERVRDCESSRLTGCRDWWGHRSGRGETVCQRVGVVGIAFSFFSPSAVD